MKPLLGKRIKYLTLAVLGCVACLYIFQGFLIRYRLNQLGAEKVSFLAKSELCDTQNCTATWDFTVDHRFLLLGQILRTYKVVRQADGQEVLPINQVQGTLSDAWARLQVYKVETGIKYNLIATKPRATKMDYFAGVLPRSSDHAGILSIPNLGPAIAGLATSIFFFTLVLFFAAALVANKGGSSQNNLGDRMFLHGYLMAGVFIAIATLTSLGSFDTLFPEGDQRNKIIRISFLLCLLVPLTLQLRLISKRHSKTGMLAAVALGIYIGNLAWPWLRAGQTWAIVLCVGAIFGILCFYSLKQYFAALLWGSALIDAAKIAGFFSTADYPPVYFFNLFSLFSLTLLSGNFGGFDTLSLAGRAYRRFRRDILVDGIKKQIDEATSKDSSDKILALKACLAEVSQFTGAGRVALAVNLPLGRPIILSYDSEKDCSIVYDDGTIPGVVTTRTLLYGDEVYYEPFIIFCKNKNLPLMSKQLEANIFCAVPIKVNGSTIGSMMLTKFKDKRIESGIKSTTDLIEERATLQFIAEGFSASLAQLMVNDLDKSAQMSSQLRVAINREISLSADVEDFFNRYAQSVAMICGVQVVIHENFQGQGVLVTEAGLKESDEDFFRVNPLNLTVNTPGSVGPTVVAFREGKSSFVTDFKQIMHNLHPKTVGILESMKARSIAAIPFRCNDRELVITVFTTADTVRVGPFLVTLLESTEALFVAALNVLTQKSATIALGALSNRLIGDHAIRNKIVNAAKLKSLPTTVGDAKSSFLFLIDLAGSSNLPHDPESKAKAYGYFYDEVNRKANALLSATIRKTIGDAIIVTWDGSETVLSQDIGFLEKLQNLALYADQVARSIGCKGARSILHHGKYFLGLVGTETFGQIDVIGSGIDEVCKMEGYMKSIVIDGRPAKIAISANAVNCLPGLVLDDFKEHRFFDVEVQQLGGFAIRFAGTLEEACENVA
jgi:hypothetical protein